MVKKFKENVKTNLKYGVVANYIYPQTFQSYKYIVLSNFG